MNYVSKNKIFNYPREIIFDVISDIESYEEHLPWCSKSTVLPQENGKIIGLIEISFGPFSYAFSTINTNLRPSSIIMDYKTGPFKSFDASWNFKELSTSQTEVIFDVKFSFSNPILNIPFKLFFEQVCLGMIDAFEKRLDFLSKKTSI